MHKPAISPAALTDGSQQKPKNLPTGHLLINAADEIIYANKQARHFLGLFADESLPIEQTFLSLVQSAYQCFPLFAWLDWPKRPSVTTSRYLIFPSANNPSFSLLKVEIIEQVTVDSKDIWVVAIDLVESTPETAVVRTTIC
jgi:hypothetical protein